MTFNVSTFSPYGDTDVTTKGILADTFSAYAVNNSSMKHIRSAVILGLALSGTMGTANFIEHQPRRSSTTNTYDLSYGSDLAISARSKDGGAWVTSETKHTLQPYISPKGLEVLQAAIFNTYGDVRVDVSIHTDPEDGWTKPVLTVHSGIVDFDQLMDVEDSFFDKAGSNPILRQTLPLVIISQA
jgi:hypothetical protein